MPPPPNVYELLAHAGFVRTLAQQLVRGEDAGDVVQDTWLYVLQRPPRHRGHLRAWLGSIVRSRAHNRSRGLARRKSREEAVTLPARELSAADRAAQAEIRQRVTLAVLELPEPYRTVVLMRHLSELSVKEIAERLGRPANTVQSQLQRGVAKLRAELDDLYQGDREAWCVALLAAAREEPSPVRPGGWAGAPASAMLQRLALVAALGVATTAAIVVTLPTGPEENGSIEFPGPGFVGSTRDVPLLGASGENARAPILMADRSTAGPEAEESARAHVAARTLDVKVTDSDGAPARGARVFVLDRDSRTGMWTRIARAHTEATGEDGRVLVHIDELDPIDRHYSDPDGPPRVGVLAMLDDRAASLAHYVPIPDSGPAYIELALRGPGTCLRGRLLGPDGEAIGGASISVSPIDVRVVESSTGALASDDPRVANTDGDGAFELEGLAPGRVLLVASAEGWAESWWQRDLEAGSNSDCTLVIEHGATVIGVARGPAGEPEVGARVWADRMGEIRAAETVSDADGFFALAGLRHGARRLWAQSAREPALVATTLRTIAPGEEVAWEADLVPSVGLRLRLLDEHGAPLAGWRATLELSTAYPTWTRELVVGADGRIVVFDHPAERLRLVVTDPLDRADRALFPAAVVDDLHAAEEERTIVVETARTARAILEGRLVSSAGEPFADARLHLRRSIDRRMVDFPVEPDGSFRIEGVPCGRWVIEAWCGAAGGASLGEQMLGSGETLELGEVRTEPAGELTIEWPLPVANSEYWISRPVVAEGERTALWIIERGSAGDRARFSLLPGEYELSLDRDGMPLAPRPFTIRTGESVRLQELPR